MVRWEEAYGIYHNKSFPQYIKNLTTGITWYEDRIFWKYTGGRKWNDTTSIENRRIEKVLKIKFFSRFL